MTRWLSIVLLTTYPSLLGCSSQPATMVRPPTPQAAPPQKAVDAEPLNDSVHVVYGGMHWKDNVIDFNPRDLGPEWKASPLLRLPAGTPIWLATAAGVVDATVERVEITRDEGDPKHLTSGTVKVHTRTATRLPAEITLLCLWRPGPRTWSTRGVTDDEEAFAKNETKKQFQTITGTEYTGPMTYPDPRTGRYTIDFDKGGMGAFALETAKGEFLIVAFQIPGADMGHVSIFRKETGAEWTEVTSFNDDYRARFPWLDVNEDGVPELLHSGAYSQGWDLAAFFPSVRPILKVSP